MMNTKQFQKHFDQLGVQFATRSQEEVHRLGDYNRWRNRIHRPELRAWMEACLQTRAHPRRTNGRY